MSIGVVSAGFTTFLPYTVRLAAGPITVEGRPDPGDRSNVAYHPVRDARLPEHARRAASSRSRVLGSGYRDATRCPRQRPRDRGLRG